jgi:hypothetical protein
MQCERIGESKHAGATGVTASNSPKQKATRTRKDAIYLDQKQLWCGSRNFGVYSYMCSWTVTNIFSIREWPGRYVIQWTTGTAIKEMTDDNHFASMRQLLKLGVGGRLCVLLVGQCDWHIEVGSLGAVYACCSPGNLIGVLINILSPLRVRCWFSCTQYQCRIVAL